MKAFFLAAGALFAVPLSGCITNPPQSVSQTVTVVAQAAAAIADAAKIAPPGTIMTADVKGKAAIAVSAALNIFDSTLTGIDALVSAKAIVPGSPTALKVKQGVKDVQAALNAASAAVAVGNATSYQSAIATAQTALASISTALK